MDARSLSDFFSHNGYGCPLPLQAATAAAAADGSAVCFFMGSHLFGRLGQKRIRCGCSGPKQPQWAETAPVDRNSLVFPMRPKQPQQRLRRLSAVGRSWVWSKSGLVHPLFHAFS